MAVLAFNIVFEVHSLFSIISHRIFVNFNFFSFCICTFSPFDLCVCICIYIMLPSLIKNVIGTTFFTINFIILGDLI